MDSGRFSHRNPPGQAIMKLYIAMALGADRVAGSVRNQSTVSLFRTYVGEAPYVINLGGLRKFFQIPNCLSSRHPRSRVSLGRRSQERLDALCRSNEQNSFSRLWNSVISCPVELVANVVSQSPEVRKYLLKPRFVAQQSFHVFGDKNLRLYKSNRFDHGLIQSASTPIHACAFAVDGLRLPFGASAADPGDS